MAAVRFGKLWLSWTFIGLLTALCASLAVIQSRWINELGTAERDRLHAVLQSDLNRVSHDFDEQAAASCSGLIPSFADVMEWGSEAACSRQYQRWRMANGPTFRRIGLLNQENVEPELFLLDPETGAFARAEWPAEWSSVRSRFDARRNGSALPPLEPAASGVLEFPLFGSLHHSTGLLQDGSFGPPDEKHEAAQPPRLPEEDWLVLELSVDYLRSKVLPPLLSEYLAGSGLAEYDAEVVAQRNPSTTIFAIGTQNRGARREPDASAALLALNSGEKLRGRTSTPLMAASTVDPARWRLLIFPRTGSLEDKVTSARVRNFALSGSILLLIVAMVAVLLHHSRQAQRLASLQMSFVAGVSHELRTPLTVIRTAAFNLRGRVATRPEQVERYGQLIQKESEKLSTLVEQVLRYGVARAGRVIGERRPVAPGKLIESSVEASSANSTHGKVTLERHVDPGLPLVLVDELAIRHALQNLLDNAVKYGLEGSDWIGVFAEAVTEGETRLVEIRVADRGPGIPDEEQIHLFEAFFRGKRAVRDQVHGTGLGLNLVKSIVDAHGGTIHVKSEPFRGTQFIMRIPAAPEDLEDVFANTPG